jgi:hypothetical protein
LLDRDNTFHRSSGCSPRIQIKKGTTVLSTVSDREGLSLLLPS